MKYLQIPVNSSNIEHFPLFTSKDHHRVCWVICIILQLQRTAIENSRIDKIDMINKIYRINCINQYEDNQYDQYDLLTLQTSPTQLQQCCFLFRFSWLNKVSSIFCITSSIILLVRSPLIPLLLMFRTQSYSDTHSRGDTALPMRNGLLLCISRPAVSSWIYPTNRNLFLCSRRYLLQQVGSDNNINHLGQI